jgi:hypothetical protein
VAIAVDGNPIDATVNTSGLWSLIFGDQDHDIINASDGAHLYDRNRCGSWKRHHRK